MLNDVTFGQYYPTQSFVHRLDPRVKLLFLIAYIVMLFVSNSFYGLALCGVILVVAVIAAKVPVLSVLRSVKGVIVILVFTSLLNVLFHVGEGKPLAEWWIFHIYLEGIIFAVALTLRLFLVVMASSLLTLTTTPVSLCDGLESLLFPLALIKVPVHVLALVMSIALRFIPTLIDETNRIISAQKARGAAFDSGNVFKRVKAIIPVLVPLILSAFRRADELGDAMDARCYGVSNKRTRYKKLRLGWRDGITALLFAAMIAGVILFNIFGYDVYPQIYPFMVLV